jgi:predicted MFS family arabinose efflux permease
VTSVAQSGATTTRPVRNRVTWLEYIQLAFWAAFLYGFGATNALLRDEQGTTRAVAGLHGTALAIGGLIGGLITARVIDTWGRGRVLRVAAIAASASILLYTVPHGALPATLAGAFLASLFGTLLLISVNAFLLDYQGLAGPTALTEANALASFAGILGPLAIGAAAATALGWRAGMWAIVIGLLAIEVWRGRDLDTYGTKGLAAHEDAPGRLPRRVYWSLALIMCFLGAEFCLTFWGADLLRERCNFGPAAAAASIGAISGGMLVGRLLGARFAQRIPTETILRASVVFALFAFALAWSFTWWPIVITGLFLTGVGIGVDWPLGVARTVRASGGMTDRASASASIAGSVAIATAPIVLGVLSDHIDFHVAFLLVPVLLLLALGILMLKPVPDLEPAEAPAQSS